MKKNVWQMLDSYLCMQKDLEKDNGHSLVLVLGKGGFLSKKTVHKEFGTKLQKGCCWNSLRADVQFFRATSLLYRGHFKSKGGEKMSIHYCADMETIESFSHDCYCKSAQSLRSSRRDM